MTKTECLFRSLSGSYGGIKMGFLDDITKSAKSIASKAVKKTGEVAESAKLAIALRSEESKLEGLFAALGKLTYEKADAALIAAEILEIDEQKNVIKQIKTEIAENSGKTFCPACGKEIPDDARFCPACGKSQEKKTEAKAEPAPEKKTEDEKKNMKTETTTPVVANTKPLTAEEFVEFFKATMVKYGFTK